jgi:hypothetical protein
VDKKDRAAFRRSLELGARLSEQAAGDDQLLDLLRGASFADRYYNKLPETIGSTGFAARSNDSFKYVEEMYRQRNSLIHSGAFKR